MTMVAIALLGGLGAVARFVVDGLLMARRERTYPAGTLVVNVTGSFAAGLLLGWAAGRTDAAAAQALLGTGFLGGFTTFSAASVELVAQLLARRPVVAAVVGLALPIAALAAAGLGYALTTG